MHGTSYVFHFIKARKKMEISLEIIIALVLGITIHEFSHAWMANFLGDPTAKMEGRLSLNPFVHMDPLGTIMLLLVHFGWGKPVPYNPHYLKNPRSGSILIALAGPLSNFLMALLLSIPLKYISPFHPIFQLLYLCVFINLGLMVFNLLPIPPLDGSKILASVIPSKYASHVYTYLHKGPIILLIIIIIERITNIHILSTILITIIQRIAIFIGLTT